MGTCFLLPVLADYIRTGLVPKMPSFVASIFFFIAALQSFFGGLILETIVKKNKQDFEINYNKCTDRWKDLKRRENNL